MRISDYIFLGAIAIIFLIVSFLFHYKIETNGWMTVGMIAFFVVLGMIKNFLPNTIAGAWLNKEIYSKKSALIFSVVIVAIVTGAGVLIILSV